MHLLELPSGLRFGFLGDKPATPAPTLFIFASSIEASLSDDNFCRVGRIAEEQGYLCVALDVPCHGSDKREGEPAGLDGWRMRLQNGENPFARFAEQCSEVLDYLVEQEYSDPHNIAVSGVSRGGFCAAHFAAQDERVRSVLGLAPVTRLQALREFNGLEEHALLNSAALVHLADRLAERSLWVIIGNRDERVNTDYAIEFAGAVVAAASCKIDSETLADVTLHVLPSVGHHCPDGTHEMAAQWLLERMQPKP